MEISLSGWSQLAILATEVTLISFERPNEAAEEENDEKSLSLFDFVFSENIFLRVRKNSVLVLLFTELVAVLCQHWCERLRNSCSCTYPSIP